jgi:16S rRNA (adenine1518-N6/adenine1519-N6)-dimethyltransferase
LKKRAFRPKKRLGQNFLHDSAIAERIVDAAKLAPSAVVVELGAGKGILTHPLVERGVRLIAIELDGELYEELRRSFATGGESMGVSTRLPQRATTPMRARTGADKRSSAPSVSKRTRTAGTERHLSTSADETPTGRVEIIHADFTKLSITGLLASRGVERCTLFGNIPYHLTRDVLFSFLVDEREMIEAGYLMLQREVGERIVSPPGSRVYGITSVVLQSLYAVRPLFRVGPGAFFPRPRVESIVIEFKPLDAVVIEPEELSVFVPLVKNLFQQRRKTIHNTLKRFYSLSEGELGEIARAAGVSLDKRPEELGKEAFAGLSRAVSRIGARG